MATTIIGHPVRFKLTSTDIQGRTVDYLTATRRIFIEQKIESIITESIIFINFIFYKKKKKHEKGKRKRIW